MWLFRLTLLALLVWAAESVAGEPPATPGTIRQVSSQHLTLFTDLPPGNEVDALPGIFDQAYPQWCAYFGTDPRQAASWRMRGYLMKVRDRFQAAGLVPADLPEFLNGYARGDQLWLYDQTSPYYRRHLLLHEGTHAFMASIAGSDGPAWFNEGMAELLATHRWENGQLTLKYFPLDRGEVSKWGRIEIVQTAFAQQRAMTLGKVLSLANRDFLQNEAYGWSWAAAAFLDHHPDYQDRFRQLARGAQAKTFAAQFPQAFGEDRPRMDEQWQLFVANLDYGYDFERELVEFTKGKPLAEKTTVSVAADRGWQASGVQLAAGKTYRLRASGRYQVAQEPRPWWCEPGGVTIRYYHGQPLGILLAGVRSDEANPTGPHGLIKPSVIGLERTLKPRQTGTLYLRINDSAGSLADNRGSLEVELVEE